MSRFGILIVIVALSAGLAAQTSGAQVQDPSDATSVQPLTPVPWFDPSLAKAPDKAKMLAISVATVHNCSAGSAAICYGFCAPSSDHSSDHANREQAATRTPPIKQPNAIKSKRTKPDETEN